jgi:hypothetical protein
MAKKSSVGGVTFKSIRDMTYDHAVVDDSLKSHAQFAIDEFSNFPEELSKEERAQCYEGYMARYTELYPKMKYANVGGNWLPLDSLSVDAKPREIVEWNGAYALLAFSQQAFGAIKNDDPSKYKILGDMRTKAIKYASGKIKSLQTKAKEIIREKNGEAKVKAANKAFAEVVTVSHTELKSRCKTAVSRGDDSADESKLKLAIDAFNAVWLK